MSIPNPEFLESAQIFRGFNKAVHPKVLNILERLRPPSPTRVPRDHHQPKAGDLREKVSFPYNTESISLMQSKFTARPNEPALNLSSSKLLNRRRGTKAV